MGNPLVFDQSFTSSCNFLLRSNTTHFLPLILILLSDFILGSMHKAKGLEFDTVIITDDFRALQALPVQEQGGLSLYHLLVVCIFADVHFITFVCSGTCRNIGMSLLSLANISVIFSVGIE